MSKIILEFSECKVPLQESEVKNFLKERIKSGKTKLRFYGNELDGHITCNEGEFLKELENSAYVNIYYDESENATINYKMDQNDVFKMVLSLLEKYDIDHISLGKSQADIYIS